ERHNLGAELMHSMSSIAFVGSSGTFILKQVSFIAPAFASYVAQNLSIGDAIRNIHKNGRFNTDNKSIVLYGCPEVRTNLPLKTLGDANGKRPQNLTLLRQSNSQIKLSWDVVSGAQNYFIERAEQSPGRKRADGWVNVSSTTNNEYLDNGVTSNKVYLYRVWAIDSKNLKSGYSAVDSVSTYSQSLLPQSPVNLNVTPDCYTAIISWDQPATVQSGTYYNVKRRHLQSGASQCEFAVVENTVQAKDVFDCGAENGVLSGSAQIGTASEGFKGTGYVDGFVSSLTAAVSFETKVLVAGDYTLSLRYSAANGNSTNIGLYVNNVKIRNITCQQTVNEKGYGSWNVWSKQSETVRLNSGINNIEYRAEWSSTNSIVMDHFYLKAVNSYIDNNLIPGEEYEYTVSTVNKYGESKNCNPTVIVKPELRAPTVIPVLDRVDNVSCNAFEYYWYNLTENARLCNEIQYSYNKSPVEVLIELRVQSC
ncbi:MAG: CBM35 domain-containing protein, partial [Fibrobacter sp.]|nr:CBM35 domain-containing protein [Fibrobacter sp.]